MEKYKHLVQYYETDKMGITHHSNYIRFMEEARTDFLNQIGWGYENFEKNGLSSLVVSVECDFKKSTTYSDEIIIDVFILDISPAKITIGYEMTSKSEIVCLGKSVHCFLNNQAKPIAIKKVSEEFYNNLMAFKREK